MNFKPMLPSGLDVEAVSTSAFGVSGTDRGVGRVIIAEVADDPDNDATVISAANGDAILRFPQDGTTAKGQPPIEQLEWIADGVRFSVVIQLGPDAVVRNPTIDESISQFISSFAPLGIPLSSLQAAPDNHRGPGAVGW